MCVSVVTSVGVCVWHFYMISLERDKFILWIMHRQRHHTTVSLDISDKSVISQFSCGQIEIHQVLIYFLYNRYFIAVCSCWDPHNIVKNRLKCFFNFKTWYCTSYSTCVDLKPRWQIVLRRCATEVYYSLLSTVYWSVKRLDLVMKRHWSENLCRWRTSSCSKMKKDALRTQQPGAHHARPSASKMHRSRG